MPSSFDMEKEAQEWEGTTLVVMAMSVPATTGVREVEAAVLDEMHLHRGDVVVSCHQLQPFLLKFVHRHHAEEAAAIRCINHHGIVLNVRPWRSLEVALGAAMLFRVRLCLEGVPVQSAVQKFDLEDVLANFPTRRANSSPSTTLDCHLRSEGCARSTSSPLAIKRRPHCQAAGGGAI